MNPAIEISDDEEDADHSIVTWDGDDSGNSNRKVDDSSILISSDEETFVKPDTKDINKEIDSLLSSDEELPAVHFKQIKSNYIKNLFPNNASTSKILSNKTTQQQPKDKGVTRMIGGVEVCLPVNPYGSQIALMAKVIEAMKKSKNCLLESPTGSGKTLALLCGALACQLHEKETKSKNLAEEFLGQHPSLNELDGASQFIATPIKNAIPPEDVFTNTNFGTKSIYDQPSDAQATRGNKRDQAARSSVSDESNDDQVKIHKKARHFNSTPDKSTCANNTMNTELSTPVKPIPEKQAQTPEQIRELYNSIKNLQVRTSMLVDSSTPTIYYGARTHKQLEQVIKEFSRTWYSGQTNMTLLSSRDYSCIREFDKQVWGTKNDMCRGCVKGLKENAPNKKETNCKFYDNRLALNRRTLPPAFDLEDLVSKGRELNACPFYAARALESDADIVFAPYNYLIDPNIRDSLQIKLEGNILIIDEAHNIENICRDAATFIVTQEQIASGIKELEVVLSYRFQNSENNTFLETLLKALLNFEQWFRNQIPLVENKAVIDGEACYKWEVQHFVQTLNNHNIGQAQYQELCRCAESLGRLHRDNPRALLGISQPTVTLVGNIGSALSYLFRDSCKYMDDFKPIFTKHVKGNFENNTKHSWRNSQFKKSINSEKYSLKFLCLNPAVVFESLKCAKSIILASGTLTPMISFHSELGTDFALQVSPNHVIPEDRVWIGSLISGRHGALSCNSRGLSSAATQDELGAALAAVCAATPHGVLCFLPSYRALATLTARWQETGRWANLEKLKYIYQERNNVHEHSEIMEEFQKRVCEGKGALLLAVYRGKVSEGMDFKDRQARAVVTIGIPFPNTYDVAVIEKKLYNNKYTVPRKLLDGEEWLKVQAYRALNQAVGRCVRHREDWGAVLMIDGRFAHDHYTQYLSKWVRKFLGRNHHTIDSLVDSENGLKNFMDRMSLNNET